jgi:hypothetical protein
MHLLGQDVEHANAMAHLQQFVAEMRTDEPGAPGDEDLHAPR